MAKGFVYLTAVVDWSSRKVLAAKVAITLESCHAVDVLQEAFETDTRECTVCGQVRQSGMNPHYGTRIPC